MLTLVESNLQELNALTETNDETEFHIRVNTAVINIIEAYQEVEVGSMSDEFDDEEIYIHRDVGTGNLPIPVLSNTSPTNVTQFLTHVILSLGKYDTEIDALTHRTSRGCLKAVGLIGDQSDADSLQQYSNMLTKRYIEEQVVYYPNSIKKAEKILVMAKKVFDDVIVHNTMSMNELPLFTMATVRRVRTAENDAFWQNIKSSQLDSVYATLQHSQGIPDCVKLTTVRRLSPMRWSPTDTMPRYENQSEQSYEEQKIATDMIVNQINEYQNTVSRGRTYTKNPVVYGAPGSGKSFVGAVAVLYSITQGLNTMTTTLMILIWFPKKKM